MHDYKRPCARRTHLNTFDGGEELSSSSPSDVEHEQVQYTVQCLIHLEIFASPSIHSCLG